MGNAFTKEGLVESAPVPCEDGIRFFGAARFSSDQVDVVCSVLSEESAVVVALDPSHGRGFLESLVTVGWAQAGSRPPEEILKSVCSAGGLVLDIYGEFDDVDVATAVFGRLDVVACLID